MTSLTFHNIFFTFLILFSSTITLTHVFAGNSKVDPCANIFCWNLLSRGSPSRLQIQKLLTDKSKLFVCQISRLGFAYSYITIIMITITDWKDIYFLKADSVGQRSVLGYLFTSDSFDRQVDHRKYRLQRLERKLLWIYLLCWMCYCWLGGLVLRASISAILSFIHLWEDPTQRAAKVLCRKTSLFLHPRPLSAPFPTSYLRKSDSQSQSGSTLSNTHFSVTSQ